MSDENLIDGAGRNDGVYCPCPALEPYPDGEGWMTLCQWEAADDLAAHFGGVVDAARREVRVPYAASLMRNYFRVSFRPPLDLFELAFSPGCVVLLDHPALTGGRT